MKKVPVLGQIEDSMDNTIKDLMGPLRGFYPLLKTGIILSNPATLTAYAAYRAIPYALDGLASNRAMNAYKTVGKTIGNGALALGYGTLKLGAKLSKEAIVGLSNIGKKQFENVNNYFADKDFSFSNIKDKIADLSFIGKEEYQNERVSLQPRSLEQEKIAFNNNLKTANILFGFEKPKNEKELQRSFQSFTKRREYIKPFKIESDKNVEREEINNIVSNKKEDVSNLFKPQEPETIEFGESISSESFYRNKKALKNDSLSISDDCKVFFERNDDGSYTQTFEFDGEKGQSMTITEEQYLNFYKDLDNYKEKELDNELEF